MGYWYPLNLTNVEGLEGLRLVGVLPRFFPALQEELIRSVAAGAVHPAPLVL